jgi:NAD(P)-dependent dehydrogenase (short-subunit alcohol dehydrogenase family)
MADAFSLEGKTAIVTGASSGLGVAFAEALSEAGASLALGARRDDKLREVARKIEAKGGKVLVSKMDVRNPVDCQRVTEEAIDTFGTIDILVNNAGVGTAHPATRETVQQFSDVIDVNLSGAYWMAQACGRVMRAGSCIVNIASILALTTAELPQAAYSASKAGLLGLTRDLAQQWGPRRGIRVNAIAPGFFDSEMTEQYRPGYMQTQMRRVLLGRMGDPRELAGTLVWLVSPAAGYVTGQTIVVDGGFTIT